jgi:MFS family permease
LLQGSLTQLYISFFLMTVLGSGTLPASYTRFVLSWFDTRRGLGMGIAMSGVGVAALVLPPVTQGLIALFGWRVAIAATGGILLVAGMANCLTLVRLKPRGPEEIDGGLPAAKPLPEIDGLSWREAMATTSFWLITLAFIPLGVASMGLLVNLPSILADQGWEPGRAALIFSLLGATMIGARLLAGGLLDRWRTVYVVMAIFASPVAGFLLLASRTDGLSTALAIFLIAFGIGAEFDVMAYLISRLFGRRSYGVLYGCVYAAYNVGVSIGPVWLASQFAASGSYGHALAIFGALFLGSGMLLAYISTRLSRPAHNSPAV